MNNMHRLILPEHVIKGKCTSGNKCRYLATKIPHEPGKHYCLKGEPLLKQLIDLEVNKHEALGKTLDKKTMVATGDNCSGFDYNDFDIGEMF